jgi:NADPH:quinone reductase
MAPYGRIVTLMGFPGDDAELNACNLNLSLLSVMMLTPMWKGLETRLREQAEIIRNALGLIASGKLKIRHAATFPLAQANKAQALLESGQASGKVTLQIRQYI